jgi:DUF2971 family protein
VANIRLTVLSESAADIRGKLHYGGPGTVFCRGPGSDNCVCGRCGATLTQGAAPGVFENGALKCNSCGDYNDLMRPAQHSTLPPMLRDIAALPPPNLRDWIDEAWEISPRTAELRTLRTELNGAWMQEQGQPPGQIFHYTSSHGLRGILASHQLWATDIAYMNDATEMAYGLALIAKHLAQAATDAPDLEKEFFRRSDVSESTVIHRGDFVTCFCADGDQLSQWRSYAAAGSGCAIGFSTRALLEHNQPILRRVIYEPAVQERMIQTVISRSRVLFREVSTGRSIKDLDDDRTLPAFASFLASRLKEFACTFKHPGFQEEKEWRLIFRGFRSREFMPALRFREDSLSTPYIPISLRNAGPSPPALLPILEVRHGPSIHPGLARKSLLLLLEKFGYDHVEVRGSSTPLRP